MEHPILNKLKDVLIDLSAECSNNKELLKYIDESNIFGQDITESALQLIDSNDPYYSGSSIKG